MSKVFKVLQRIASSFDNTKQYDKADYITRIMKKMADRIDDDIAGGNYQFGDESHLNWLRKNNPPVAKMVEESIYNKSEKPVDYKYEVGTSAGPMKTHKSRIPGNLPNRSIFTQQEEESMGEFGRRLEDRANSQGQFQAPVKYHGGSEPGSQREFVFDPDILREGQEGEEKDWVTVYVPDLLEGIKQAIETGDYSRLPEEIRERVQNTEDPLGYSKRKVYPSLMEPAEGIDYNSY